EEETGPLPPKSVRRRSGGASGASRASRLPRGLHRCGVAAPAAGARGSAPQQWLPRRPGRRLSCPRSPQVRRSFQRSPPWGSSRQSAPAEARGGAAQAPASRRRSRPPGRGRRRARAARGTAQRLWPMPPRPLRKLRLVGMLALSALNNYARALPQRSDVGLGCALMMVDIIPHLSHPCTSSSFSSTPG
ncbi:unnamed protein product, partial [Prorocentrum cordatum]